jgi:hypothetical protein
MNWQPFMLKKPIYLDRKVISEHGYQQNMTERKITKINK